MYNSNHVSLSISQLPPISTNEILFVDHSSLIPPSVRSSNDRICRLYADNAGSNKAATSATGLNTKRLDDETDVLARE